MASSDVEAENGEESILYDLTVHAEWKQENEVFRRAVGRDVNVSTLGRFSSSTQRSGWTALRSLGLQTASPCHLPPALVKLVNCNINWHISITRDGKLVGILQDQCIEIRSNRDDYSTVTGRVSLQRDSYPQWRRLVWSIDNTMLACSYSSGTVEVYDIVGTLLFTIPGKEASPTSKLPTDLSEAVAALIFTDTKTQQEDWSSELLVVNYHGNLSSYLVDRDHGYKLQHNFLFNVCYSLGISCVAYDKGAGLLYVGGCGQEDDCSSLAGQDGLTAWRILSDFPHYKLVTDYSEDLSKSQSKRSRWGRFKMPSMSYMKAQTCDGIYKLSLSPGAKYLVTLHHSGKLSLWTVPGLKLQRAWKHDEQTFYDELSPEFTENPALRKQVKDLVNTRNLLDINWWSEEAVILARGSGAVTVSSIKSLNNLLGTQPEWFEPAPNVSQVHDGGFLGLEVECRFPKKRRFVSGSDDEEEESDEEEAGLISRSWGVAKHCMHYVTDMDRFKPPKKKPKLVNRTYRLVCLKSTTPEELFARKLEDEEYGEAKALAQAYGLDTDLVYKRQWSKSPVEISSIQDYLSKISKRSWVLHECIERMSDKIDAMKELLEFGLRGTDLPALIQIGLGEDKGRFILCDPDDGLYEDMELEDEFDPETHEKREQLKLERRAELIDQVNFDNLTLEQRELCRARKKLVQYLYRLKTYECILGGSNYAAERFDQKFFEKFRSQNIVETAVTYAQNSDWKALETLFTFHSGELAPHRLAILSNFPETTCPSEFKTLLPEVSNNEVTSWPSELWDRADWCEIEPCKSALEPVKVDIGEYLYESQPLLQKYRDTISLDMLCCWYEFRAKEIERLSRQADYALEFVKLGVERGVEGLDNVLDDLVTMEMLVYSCHVDDLLTFKQLQDMADYDKLELIMSKSPDDMYTKNLRKWMVPFLKQCERHAPGAYIHLLRDYVFTMARADLNRPLQIFVASKTHLPNPIIPKQAELMTLAIETIYSSQRDDQLQIAFEILKCLPQRGYGADTKETKRLHEQVDKLEHHLNAAKILEENGITKPVFYIRDTQSQANDAEQLMIKLSRMVGRRDGVVTEAQWSKLHVEMMQLQDKVYRCISPGLCHEIFVEGLLCSSNTNYIQLAGRMVERSEDESRRPTPTVYNMQTRVPYDRSIELILAASQEYFNSSANLTDTCMGLARSCLNLIQDHPDSIQEESDLISSLSLLEDFGVNILPLQVRLCDSRLEFVETAVETKQAAYKQKQKLLRLGHLLRIKADDRTDRDDKVLHLLARAAIKAEDFPYAYEVCGQLMTDGHGPAWDVCVDLAEHELFKNVTAKVELLSFAVTFCTPDMIEPILQAKALLETQVLFEGISSHVQDSTDETTNKRTSPFSTTAALQQTQQILTSTKQTTKAMLSTVTDAKWWQGTVSRLKQPTKRQVSHDMTNRNKNLELQACHPFYEGFIENCYYNVDEGDFRHLEMHIDPSVQMSEKLLRTAQLEEMLTEGTQSQSATEVLLQLASESFYTDHTLSLAYLLALQQPIEADRCFEEHHKTDISLQLALYYYTLQLYTCVRPSDIQELSSLYLYHPVKVMQKVTNLISQKKDFDWPDNVIVLVTKIKHYNEMLEDYRQAKVLKKLGRGIDVDRFTEDSEYKEETILGLAESLEDSIYNISLSLADRYSIPLWLVYAAHLEYLFCDSGLSVDDIDARVTKLGILTTLKSRPDEFCDRMFTYVYPSLDGSDQACMMYYYTTMSGCSQQLHGGMTADGHVKLLKKLRQAVPDLDYKALMSADVSVIEVLSPCLTTTNISTVAKLAKQVPDGHGGSLEGSIVYCTWAVKYFWEADGKKEPDSLSGWMHRYEACGDYIGKLLPKNIQQFIQAILFTRRSRSQLSVECRHELCRRLLKYCRQQSGKKRKPEESKDFTWDSLTMIVNGYLKHFESLSSPVVMAMSQSEVKRVQEYLEQYDLSMGLKETIHKLLVTMVIDGDLPLVTVHEFMSVVAMETVSLTTIVHDALDYHLHKLSETESPLKLDITMETLPSLQKIVLNVQEHIEDSGDLINAEDILYQLRPFCSNVTVAVQPRLDVLHILEKSFKLSEEDSVLLTLYRTQAVVTTAWPEYKVTEEEILSHDARHKLFSTLLGENSTAKGDDSRQLEFSALCRLLKLWPIFPSAGSDIDSPWVTVFKVMIDSGCHDNIKLVVETVKTTDNLSLSYESVDVLFISMVTKEYPLDAVHLALVCGQEKMFTVAMEKLAPLPQIDEEEELVTLILKHKLVPLLVHSVHYPVIIRYLLANQDAESQSHDFLSIQKLANQLRDSGFESEAGSLMLQAKSAHPMLQTFGSALGYINKWFK